MQIGRILGTLSAAQWLAVWPSIWFCATVVLALWE
jgi:hypothetical protein